MMIMQAQKTRAGGVSILTKETVREAFVTILNSQMNNAEVISRLSEVISKAEGCEKDRITKLIWSTGKIGSYISHWVGPEATAQMREKHGKGNLAREAALVAEIFDYIRENTDFKEFEAPKILGVGKLNRTGAVRIMESDRTFAPLVRARKMDVRGSYWISTKGLSSFIDPDHSYYIDNRNGTFSRCTEEEWWDASWAERLFFTPAARNEIILGARHPLILIIGERDTERLRIESGEIDVALVASVPKVKANPATEQTPEIRFPAWRVRDAKGELEALGVDLGRAPALSEMFRDV